MARQGFAENTEEEFDVILLREQLGVYHPDDRFTGETLRAISQERSPGSGVRVLCLSEPVSFLGKTEREPKKLA